jgi:porin
VKGLKMVGKKTIRRSLVLSAAMAAGLGTSVAHAEDAKPAPSFWTQETLTGDWGGARTQLKDKGIEIKLNYIGEAFAVFSGGLKRGSTYQGRLEFSVDTDLDKLIGWKGASTHFTIYQIHDGGRNAVENVGSIADPSNIDALSTTRLFTAWFQQGSPDDDPFSIRIGQLAADDEFITSDTAGGLINGTFGWAGILAANIASGGPAYPLATPGVRVQYRATNNLVVRAALFSGDPAGDNCSGNPQACNRHGTTFSFDGGALWMGEVQYNVNQDKKAGGLPGVYKLGAWYATADYADQHFGRNALGGVVSLADPAAVNPLNHRGNWGVYGVLDQMIWKGNESSTNIFVRGGVSPSDRNLLSYYVDGGVGFKGPLPGRADDVFTLGMAYANISNDASALDRDIQALAPPYPIRSHELVLEASYTIQVAPWWTIQPDLQYIVHPGGNVPDPFSIDNRPVKDAFLGAVRTTIKF